MFPRSIHFDGPTFTCSHQLYTVFIFWKKKNLCLCYTTKRCLNNTWRHYPRITAVWMLPRNFSNWDFLWLDECLELTKYLLLFLPINFARTFYKISLIFCGTFQVYSWISRIFLEFTIIIFYFLIYLTPVQNKLNLRLVCIGVPNNQEPFIFNCKGWRAKWSKNQLQFFV